MMIMIININYVDYGDRQTNIYGIKFFIALSFLGRETFVGHLVYV